MITQSTMVSRRRALKFAAASATLPLVHIRTGRAAGKVSIGFWDHWVPEGNDIMKKQCEAFGRGRTRSRSSQISSPRSGRRTS